ncbi:hypothetical protein [Thiocystis violascens]|uniref:Uncharacterized protein n=1 Tax=Thiocystis violascens (strain ATCC 17096 / DSM 198 / 6111) TaxID=765911 RepID=I3YDG0_THIV6|nr:hypothetical protein [Thiocystis violascens]AFL75028.1 hypothetical protein Thivi_3151 [Thiocystis violascens DSM 198]
MSAQIDYQILLEEVVRTAKAAAEQAVDEPFEHGLKAAYYDILDVVKTQAEVMEVPLSEIGLGDFDPDSLLGPRRAA